MLREIPLVFSLLLSSAVLRTGGDCSKSIAVGGFDDPASKAVAAAVVFEGTMVKMARISNPEGAGLPEISAVKFTVEKIHKGELPTAEGARSEMFRPVFLRVERGCVQNLVSNQRYFVFLSSSWNSVGHDETLHWASGAPVKYSKKIAKEVLGHICRNCGSASSSSSAPSAIVRLLPGRNLSVGIDSDVIIKCIAIGKPRPQVTWFKNDQPLENADQRLLRKSFKIESLLHIKGVEYEDNARLWCQAQNVLGSVNSSVLTLTVAKENGMTPSRRSHYLPCPDPRYCLKGDCHVLPGAPKPRCTCPEGYTGERCQDREDDFDFSKIDVKTSSLDRILAFGTLLFQFLIFVIVVAVLHFITRLRRQLREGSTTRRYGSAETTEFRGMNAYEKERSSWLSEDPTEAAKDNGYRSASDLVSLDSSRRETEEGAEVKVHALR